MRYDSNAYDGAEPNDDGGTCSAADWAERTGDKTAHRTEAGAGGFDKSIRVRDEVVGAVGAGGVAAVDGVAGGVVAGLGS